MKAKMLLPICIAVALISSCNKKPSASEVVTHQLDLLFDSLYTANNPGAAVLVVKDDSIMYNKSFGLADLETKKPITDSTFFNIASVSKQFTSAAIFTLAEEGKLSLDDVVSKFFPDFKADFYKHITLRHLLSHTSGIPDLRDRTDRNFVLFCNEQESCSYLKELDSLKFEPGTQYDYQNPTYQLLQLVVEQVSGDTFDDFMRNRVFAPAGMTETVYFEPNRHIPRMAHAYLQADEGTEWTEYDYGEASFFGTKGDGALYTSPKEFIQWDKALCNNTLFSKTIKEEAHSGKIATDIPYTTYGYGWFIEERPDRPRKVYHTGDNGGFQIYAGRFPDKNLFYLVFANRNDKDREQTIEKMDQLFEAAGWLK